jgi:hypothetical protein
MSTAKDSPNYFSFIFFSLFPLIPPPHPPFFWQVSIQRVFRGHIGRNDYRFEMEKTERMRNIPYIQVYLYSRNLLPLRST